MIGEILGAIGGVKSVFGGKDGTGAKTRKGILGQAEGARLGAQKYGFNPLTLLGASSPLAASGPPPLASWEFLSEAVTGIEKEMNGEADIERKERELQHDIARVKLDALRGGAAVAYNSAADEVGERSPLGGRAVTLSQSPMRLRSGATDRLSDPVVLTPGNSGGYAVPDERFDRGAGVFAGGKRVEPAPGWSPASVIENEYGDVGSWFYGLGKMSADVLHTLDQNIGARDKGDDQTKWSAYKLRNTYGKSPDGFNPDGLPYWKYGDVISFTPPNQLKVR